MDEFAHPARQHRHVEVLLWAGIVQTNAISILSATLIDADMVVVDENDLSY
jgi:hypothetical protein